MNMRVLAVGVVALGVGLAVRAQNTIDANVNNISRPLGGTWWFDDNNSGNSIGLTNVNGSPLALGLMPGWAHTQWQFLWYTNGVVAEAGTANAVKSGAANYELAGANDIYDTGAAAITVTNNKTLGSITTWRDVLINSGVTLTLTRGGVMFHNQSHWIKNNGGQGYLTSSYGDGSGTNELFVVCNGSSTDYQINDVIIANDGATPVLVAKDGNDHVRFGAANTYSGGTAINRGRLQAGNAAALGTGTAIVRNNNAQAYLSDPVTYANNFEIAGNGWSEVAGPLGAIRMENNTRIGGTVTLTGNARIGTYGAAPTAYLDNDVIGAYQLEKWGTGTVVIATNTSLSGPLLISQGTVRLGANGRLDNVPSITLANGWVLDASAAGGYTQAAGRVLSGYGAVGGSVVAGGDVIPGTIGSAAGIGFSNDLTYASTATNYFDLSPTWPLALGTNDVIIVGGNLDCGGAALNIRPLGALATFPDYYTLYLVTGTVNNTFGSVVVPNTRYVGTLDYSQPNRVDVSFSGGPASLVWSGGTNDWDVGLSTNWNNDTEYFQLADSTRFDDTVTGTRNVNVVGAPTPASFIVNSTGDYLFAGSGSVGGSYGLLKEGVGTLTIANPNNFTGPVTISNGTVVAANSTALGTAAGGVAVEGASVLALSNGIAVGAEALALNNADARLRNLAGTNSYGGSVTMASTGTVDVAADLLALGGSLAGAGPFVKTGAGVLALNGGSAVYTADVLVASGTLRAGNGAALGDILSQTYVANAATFDINGQNLGGEVINAQGAGVGGAGAVLNNGGGQLNATRYVNLLGDTTFGGSGRWDIRSTGTVGSAALSGGAFTLAKVGVNQFSLVGCVTTVGVLQVSNGVFSIETDTTINPEYGITVAGGGGLMLWGLNPVLGRNVDAQDASTILTTGGTVAQNIVGGTVTLTGTVTNNLAGGEMTLGGQVIGGGALWKTGGNTLYLATNNTYAGGTVIEGGAVCLGTNGLEGDVSTGPVTLAGGALRFLRSDALYVFTNSVLGTNGYVDLASNSVVRLQAPLDGGANGTVLIRVGITDNARPTLRVESGDSLRARNMYVGEAAGNRQGDILQNGGVIELTGAGNEEPFRLGHWPSMVGNTNTYTMNGGLLLVTNAGAEMNISVDGNSVWNLNGGTAVLDALLVNGRSATGWGELNVSNGLLRVGSGGIYTEGGTTYQTVLYGGRLGAYGNYTISVNAGLSNATAPFVVDPEGFTITQTGTFGGDGSLSKEGAGLLVLNGPGQYLGGLYVSNGTVRAIGAQTANRIANGGLVRVVGASSVFEFGAVNVSPTGPNSASFLLGSGGTLVFTNIDGAAGFHAHVGSIALAGGQVLSRMTADAYAGESCLLHGNVTVGGSGASLIDMQSGTLGGMALDGLRTFDVGEATGDGSTDLLINGELKGGGVLKEGVGRMELTGGNTYAGNTVISNGTLALGSTATLASPTIDVAGASAVLDVLAIAGGYTVVSGQTVMGRGKVDGSLNLAASSTVAAGSSPGRLEITGDLTMNAGATARAELAGTNQGTDYDHLAIQGAAYLDGELVVSVIDPFVPPADSIYTVLTAQAGCFGVFANAPTNGATVLAGTSILYVAYLPDAVLLVAPPSIVDNDGDGLTSDVDPNDGDPDSDDDGIGDLDDYVAFGLDGVTNASLGVFRVTSEAKVAAGTIIGWPAIGSRYYALDYSTNLLSGEAGWQLLIDSLLGPQSTYTNAPAGRGQEHYRVRVRLNP